MHRIVTILGMSFCAGSLAIVSQIAPSVFVMIAIVLVILFLLVSILRYIAPKTHPLRHFTWSLFFFTMFIGWVCGGQYAWFDEVSHERLSAELLQVKHQTSTLSILQIDGPVQRKAAHGLAFAAKVCSFYDERGAYPVAGQPVVWLTISGESKSDQTQVSSFSQKFYTASSELHAMDYIAAYVRFHAVAKGSFATALLRRKITVLATASIYGIHKVASQQHFPSVYAWQGYFLAQVQDRLRMAYGPLGMMALGFAVGDRSAISNQTIKAFAAVGIIHALVASGATIRMAINPVVILFRQKWRLRYGLWYVFSLFLIGIIVILSGLAPPALRAALVVIYELTALLVHRKRDQLTANVLAACCLVLMEPHLLLDPGVIVSFVAVMAFSLLPSRLAAWWLFFIGFPRLRMMLARGLAADLAVAPVALFEFSQLSLISLLTNIVLYPVLEWLLPMAWICLLFAILTPSIAHVLQPIVTFIYQMVITSVQNLSSLGAAMKLSAPSLSSLVVYETLLFLILFLGRRYTWRHPGKYLE